MRLVNGRIAIGTLVLFAFTQMSYFWMRAPVWFSTLMAIFLFLVFIILALNGLFQVVLCLRYRWSDLRPLRHLLLIVPVLTLTVYRPLGLIDFSRWEEPDVMTFSFEGTMRQNRIKFKANNRFVEQERSFLTVREYPGKYTMTGDTLAFIYDEKTSDHPKYAWGILQSKDKEGKPGSFEFYPDWNKKPHYTYSVNHLGR